MLEDVVRKGRLLDLYGPLLTEKQRRCMEMYFDMDLSLSEIGEELLRSAIENGALTVCKETEETKFKVLSSVQLDKSTTNSQVVAARIVRGQPYRVYEQD